MFKKEIYVKRRNILRSKVKSGLILMPGNREAPYNYPSNTYHFRQDSTFLYYFGLNHADMVGVIDIDADTDCIYANDYTIDDIIWMGDQPTVRQLAAEVGVGTTYPLRELQAVVANAIASGRKVHFLPPYRADISSMIERLLGISAASVPVYASRELVSAVISMREIKEPEEIEEIEKACEIGYAMHTTAMRMCRPGVSEREIAGVVEGIALSRGAGVSFHNILSQNGQTLHNHSHDGILEEGRLMLMDAGAENTMNYCSDNTRTIPVGGKFSPLQRDVYNVLVSAFEHAIELIKPEVRYLDVHLAACRRITEGLKELGFMKGDVDEAVASGAHALFMPHGLGHQMGLDVHDMEGLGETAVGYDSQTERSAQFGLASLRMGKKLRKGHVITCEPGIYFIPALLDKWEREHINSSFIDYDKVRSMATFGGMRVEDDILVTETGRKVLGGRRIPYTVAQIEEFMAK
ncbi:MAG: aminopeptidase P family protein [Rikenellaceae bacterium]|nr:aminopeptidase P family protein [Rikenellaceae bacterium]